MNVKQGDLAFIVSQQGTTTNGGKVVEVICYLGVSPVHYGGSIWYEGYELPIWLCRTKGSHLVPENGPTLTEAPVPDCCLRPIRPGEETTEIAGDAPALHQHEEFS